MDKIRETKTFRWKGLSVVAIEFESGFMSVGHAVTYDPLGYDDMMGEELAFDDAIHNALEMGIVI